MASTPNAALKEDHRERVVANYWRRWGERHLNKPVAAVIGVQKRLTRAEVEANHQAEVAAMTRRLLELREARLARERERAARQQQRVEAREQARRLRRREAREARRARERAQVQAAAAAVPPPPPPQVEPEPGTEFPNLLYRPFSSYLR